MKNYKVIFLDKKSPPHMLTLVLLSGVGALSMSVFLPAMLEMSRYFDTSYTLMQLSISLYLVCTAFIQLIAGIISILTVVKMYKRTQLFMSVMKVMGAYLLVYIALSITHDASFSGIQGVKISPDARKNDYHLLLD